MRPIFITGTGTDVGKTVTAAIITIALQADYWKPVQAGILEGTDSEWMRRQVDDPLLKIHPETYRFQLPASPHLAARAENMAIDLGRVTGDFEKLVTANPYLVIEGAGGVMVPLNDHEFVIDLIDKLDAAVILVSRNYLGSINHSLLTAQACRARGLKVLGWIFNDEYLDYGDQIAGWSGYPVIGHVPHLPVLDSTSLAVQADKLREKLLLSLQRSGNE